MKIRLLIVGLLFVPLCSWSQDVSPKFWIKARAGYTTFLMTDLSRLMQSTVSSYNAVGVPVQLQSDFPGNILLGGEVVYQTGMLHLGAGMYKTNTMAFFGFYDGAGVLRTKSTVHLSVLEGVVGFTVGGIGDLTAIMWIRPEYIIGFWSLHESVSFNDYPSYNQFVTIDGKAGGVGVEASLGLSYRILGPIAIEAEGGYRATANLAITVAGVKSNIGLEPGGFVGTVCVCVGF